MKALRFLSSSLLYVERVLIVSLLGIMVLLAFLQVILRNYFSTGILWADPFLRHLVLWIGFLGASLATQQEKHINIDLITRFTSPRVTNVIRIITNLFAGIVCYILASAGLTFLKSEITAGGSLFSIGETVFHAWWFQVIIPVGFALMALRFFIRTLEHIIATTRPLAEESNKITTP